MSDKGDLYQQLDSSHGFSFRGTSYLVKSFILGQLVFVRPSGRNETTRNSSIYTLIIIEINHQRLLNSQQVMNRLQLGGLRVADGISPPGGFPSDVEDAPDHFRRVLRPVDNFTSSLADECFGTRKGAFLSDAKNARKKSQNANPRFDI